jgi:hypothetical protein
MKIITPVMHILLVFSLFISTSSSCQSKEVSVDTNTVLVPNKILIVYLSRTNNTKAIAEIIHNNVGGTLVALELEKPYPENYRQTVQQVVNENERGYLPPLKI